MLRSIRSKLTATFIGLAIGPLLVVGIVLSWLTISDQKQQALDLQHQNALRVATQVDSYVRNLESVLTLTARIRSLQDLDHQQKIEVLTELLSYKNLFEELTLLDRQGMEEVRLHHVELITREMLTSRTNNQEFRQPLEHGATYFGPVRFHQVSGEPYMLIALPLTDLRSGRVNGVLVAEARLEKAWEALRALHPGPGEDLYIIDSQERLVAHHDPSKVLKKTTFRLPQKQRLITQGLNGRQVAMATVKQTYGSQTLYVVAEKELSQALALADKTTTIIAALILIALLVAVLLMVLTVGAITRPLNDLAGAAREIEEGNLSVQAAVKSRDEVGDLGRTFNAMAQKLHLSFKGLEKEIAERRIAQKQLNEAHALLKSLVDSIQDLIFYKDHHSVYLGCNYAFTQFVQMSEEELIGKTDFDLFPPEMAEFFREKDSQMLEAREARRNEEWVDYPDGRKVLLDTLKTPFYGVDGQVLGLIGVSRDITDRHTAAADKERLEVQLRQAQKMEAVGTLAGGIAHDFNNILAAILGYTELVLDDIPEENRATHDLNEVLKAANRAKQLVAQILTFSRMTDEDRHPINITPIVKEVLKLLRASIPTTIQIKQHIRDDKCVVLASPTQIHQILMNLCTNAYHAMQEHGGTLTVNQDSTTLGNEVLGRTPELPPGRYLLLEVSDTGCGMDKITAERIFEPYFTTKEQGKGTGMGLAVVHGIIKSYEGHINVYSEPGHGTTFKVYLPRVDLQALHTDTAPAEMRTGGEHILLVDDEKPIIDMGTRVLTSLGYRVTSTLSSTEALELFRSSPDEFDLVITDMAMPQMNGAELTSKLLEIRQDLPVIMCTGFSETINEERAKEIGIRDFLLKPVIKRDMASAIGRALDGG